MFFIQIFLFLSVVGVLTFLSTNTIAAKKLGLRKPRNERNQEAYAKFDCSFNYVVDLVSTISNNIAEDSDIKFVPDRKFKFNYIAYNLVITAPIAELITIEDLYRDDYSFKTGIRLDNYCLEISFQVLNSVLDYHIQFRETCFNYQHTGFDRVALAYLILKSIMVNGKAHPIKYFYSDAIMSRESFKPKLAYLLDAVPIYLATDMLLTRLNRFMTKEKMQDMVSLMMVSFHLLHPKLNPVISSVLRKRIPIVSNDADISTTPWFTGWTGIGARVIDFENFELTTVENHLADFMKAGDWYIWMRSESNKFHDDDGELKAYFDSLKPYRLASWLCDFFSIYPETFRMIQLNNSYYGTVAHQFDLGINSAEDKVVYDEFETNMLGLFNSVLNPSK